MIRTSTEYSVQSSKFKVKSPTLKTLRNPQSEIRNALGFTYTALLAALVIIGISLGAAGKYWQNVMLRDKEEELLYRGDQYRVAIERYYSAIPGRQQYPQTIEKILKDDRTPTGKRHLRRQYKDPITNEDFVPLIDQARKLIVGVRSTSDKEPLKKDNFPDPYQSFAGKTKYSEWLFIANLKAGQTSSFLITNATQTQ
jgi:type II secretory pathway pseudopilin PulG